MPSVLRTAREEHDLSLREVARRLDIDPAHLSRIERGLAFPSLCLLGRLAETVGIPYGPAMQSFSPTLGSRLRSARESVAMSQEQLADLAGVDLQELRAVENGKIPASSALRTKVELLLGVDR